MQAKLAMEDGDAERAIEWLQRVAKQDVEFVPETLGSLLECYRALGRVDELTEYLEQLSSMHAGTSPVLMLAQLSAERGDIDKAVAIILDELRSRPTVRGVSRLVKYSLLRTAGASVEPLELVQEFTNRLLEGKATYNCHNCGFAGQTLHWQCPSCKRWGTVKPIHGLEGE
jgi:lipopolysaccharide biosynthesis regulator YciM